MTPFGFERDMVLYPWEEIEEAILREMYFREQGRARVQWMGNPKGFGYSGEPTQEAALSLFEGRAGNGERLAPLTKEVGIDFTFSIGKYLSIFYSLGNEDVRAGIDRARTRAIDRTMAVAKRDYMRVRIRNGRDEANRYLEEPASWVAVRYPHSYNRQGEPFFHDHVHVSTLVQRQDGAFRRLWSKTLFVRGGEVQEALGHRHEAELREAISEEFPGLQWSLVPENGTASVEQIPSELVDALSTRARRDIEPKIAEWERENGMRATSAVKEMIAKDTRQRKELVAVMSREQIEDVARSYGFGELTIRQEILEAPPAKQHEYSSAKAIADVVLSAGGLTRMSTTFRLPSVQLAVSRAGVPASKVDAYVEEILDDPRAIKIESNKGVLWTTVELVLAEQALVELLTQEQPGVQVPLVEPEVVATVIADEGVTPNEGQLAAIQAFTMSSRATILIEANAGTGKTSYVAGLANKVWEHEGIPVLGAAPTGKAVTELKAAGVEHSRTYASLANHIRQDKPLVELTGGVPGILLTDELTMVHTREAELVFRTAVKEGFPIRGMGHSAQLQSVQAGGWFKQVTHQHADEFEEALLRLDQVIRQTDELEGKALNELAARTPQKWVEYQQKRGRLRGYGLSAEERHQATADAVKALLEHETGDVLLISPTNQLRKDLNLLAQRELRKGGRMTGAEVGLNTSEGDAIHAGDKLILKRNDRELEVDNGTRAIAIAAYDDGLLVNVKDRQVLLPINYVAEHVRLGYAVTIHDSQGATADHAIIVTPVRNLDAELAYVAASRARKTTTMFVLSDPDPQWKNLKARMRLEGAEATATEQIESAQTTPARDQARTPAKAQARAAEPPVVNEVDTALPLESGERQEPPVPNAEIHDGTSELEPDTPQAREPVEALRWPISKHREKVAELDARYELGQKTFHRAVAENERRIEAIRVIDDRVRQIRATGRKDAETTKRWQRDQLKKRESDRQDELDRLLAQRGQLHQPRDPATLSAEFMAFATGTRERKTRAAEEAAREEIETGTPVFERVLGPRPPADTQARKVWDSAALEIGQHRVEHNITDPYEHRLDLSRALNPQLRPRVDRAIGQLNKYWISQGVGIRISPSRGIGQDQGPGFGM
jgi:conjugative relaxase-like TrwC/TraI family protein